MKTILKRMIAASASFGAVAVIAGGAASAQIAIGISVGVPPPPLPVYDQPPIPAPDYIWTPGHWRWSNAAFDYYYVPGAWVLAPEPGLLWTPPWWGWSGNSYVFHDGYWGQHVGFYGGVAYGHGYTGEGYEGGMWRGGHFAYNRTVNNIDATSHVTNVYNKTVVVNRVTRVSYNGGPGGVAARPTPAQEAVAREPHMAATPLQVTHRDRAASDKQAFAKADHGRPPGPAADDRHPQAGADAAPASDGSPPQHKHGKHGADADAAEPAIAADASAPTPGRKDGEPSAVDVAAAKPTKHHRGDMAQPPAAADTPARAVPRDHARPPAEDHAKGKKADKRKPKHPDDNGGQ